jgi:hypothetical protein
MSTTSIAPSRMRSERGAVLVHVAVALTGLLAFSALTLDLGVLWAARAQAQNAADSAAMAGAVSLAYVDATNTDYAKDAARAVAGAHQIWGQASTDATVQIACPPGTPAGGECVQVEVGRGAGYGSPLPAYFSRLFVGVAASEVRAMGAAQVLFGNSTNCLKPFGIPDRWNNNREDPPVVDPSYPFNPEAGDIFERYVDEGGAAESTPLSVTPLDAYAPPNSSSSGSGYNFAQVGQRLRLVFAPYPGRMTQSSSFFPLALDRTPSTGDPNLDFVQNILTCSGREVSVGDQVETDLDIHPNFFEDGLRALIDSDPGAEWDGTRVVNSSPQYLRSPRIIPIAVYDPDEFRRTRRTTQQVDLRVRNIIGLFVESFSGGVIQGVVMVLPGRFNPAGTALNREASFLRTVALVR